MAKGELLVPLAISSIWIGYIDIKEPPGLDYFGTILLPLLALLTLHKGLDRN